MKAARWPAWPAGFLFRRKRSAGCSRVWGCTERDPRLIYCSISGYGQNGPSRDEAAMDLIVQASSGLISMTGTEAGEQVRCGYSVADVTAGLFAVIAILMALRAREASGVGQYVD